jgi:hypothetical protein
MVRLPNFDPIEYLVERRFPATKALGIPPSISSRGGSISYADREKRLAEIDAYEQELRNKAPAELQALCDAERRKETLEAIAKAERDERERFFNRPHVKADFAYWSKVAYWTLDEATALSFGKAPEVVDWKHVEPYTQVSPFAREYERLRQLTLRAKGAKQLSDPTYPGPYLAWAKRNEISIPAELEEAVKARGHQIADWQSLYENLKSRSENNESEYQKLCEEHLQMINDVIAQRDDLQARLTAYESASPASSAQGRPLSTRERDSLLSLIIGMAVAGYAYDPSQKRSDKTAEIAGDLEKAGVALDVDTVRKWLKEATQLLPPKDAE